MKTPRLTLETLLYTLAFLLALALRFMGLGAQPLGDAEATWAMQALDLARGATPIVTHHPAYVALTGALFALLPPENTLARLFPALSGSLLVLLPWLLRRRLAAIPGYSSAAGVLLAFALALDPGLVAASRTAGSAIAAVSFALLALAAAVKRRPVWAGICAALSLLSGPALWMGALGLGLAASVLLLLDRAGFLIPLVEEPANGGETPPAFGWRAFLIAAGITLLAAGTLFLRYPAGLGGVAAALGGFFQGWSAHSPLPAERVLGILAVYQPLAVLLGLVGWVRSWIKGHALLQRLGTWAVLATFVAVIYPARQPDDLIWAVVPWWALAAAALTDFLPGRTPEWEEDRLDFYTAVGHALLVFIVLLVARLYILFFLTGRVPDFILIPILAAISLIIALSTAMVGIGWSLRSAANGLVTGIAAALGLSLLAASLAAGQARPNAAATLWYPAPSAGQVDLLVRSLEDLSEWHTGERHQLDVLVSVEAPSLRWALRHFPQARFAAGQSDSKAPAALITRQQDASPNLQAAYRGQDFDWWISPDWPGFFPPDLLRWMAYGEAPLKREQVILWGRTDVFPGGELVSPDLLLPSSPEDAPLPANSKPALFP